MTDDKPIHERSPASLSAEALAMWANYIETGNVVMSAADLHHMNDPTWRVAMQRILKLTDDQIAAVRHLRALSHAIRTA